MFVKHKFLDWLSFYQMLLNDSLEFLDTHVVIPNPFWINDKNRSALTDAEAIALGTVHTFRPFSQAELF